MWLFIWLGLAIVGAALIGGAGRWARNRWRGLKREVADSMELLSRRSEFLATAGEPSDTYRQARQLAWSAVGAIEAGREADER